MQRFARVRVMEHNDDRRGAQRPPCCTVADGAHCRVRYVAYQDVFSDAPACEGLRYYLRRLPKVWLAEILGRMGGPLFNSGKCYLNPSQQIQFVQGFKHDLAFDTDRIVRVLDKGVGTHEILRPTIHYREAVPSPNYQW